MTTEQADRLCGIVLDMVKAGVLEDRREYDQSLLASVYGLPGHEANVLYELVQAKFR